MRFLRGDGPAITIEEVVQLSDDSSSSSVASSALNEESAWSDAVRSHYATIILFHRKNLPGNTRAGPSTIALQPIFIDRA